MNLKKLERYLRVNLLGPGPRLIKRIYRAAVSQRLRNTGLGGLLGPRRGPTCWRRYQIRTPAGIRTPDRPVRSL